MHKPKIILKVCIVLTVIALYSKGFKQLFAMLFSVADFNDKFFVTILAITMLVYVWKYTSISLGEGWKSDYAKLIKKVEEDDKID